MVIDAYGRPKILDFGLVGGLFGFFVGFVDPLGGLLVMMLPVLATVLTLMGIARLVQSA